MIEADKICFNGSDNFIKAYLNNELIWEKNRYTPVSWIGNGNSGVWFDTTYHLTKNSRFVISFQVMSDAAAKVFGFEDLFRSGYSGSTEREFLYRCWVHPYSSKDIRYLFDMGDDWGSTYRTWIKYTSDVVTVDCDMKNHISTATINGTTTTLSDDPITSWNKFEITQPTFGVFGYDRWRYDKHYQYEISQNNTIRLFSLKIYEDGVLTKDWIPVLDMDNRPAMLDLVDMSYYYGTGGEFTYGE